MSVIGRNIMRRWVDGLPRVVADHGLENARQSGHLWQRLPF
jgi:hypothetical protein